MSTLHAAIYTRVSTKEQGLLGYGLEAQRNELLQYIERNESLNCSLKPKHIYADVHTGSDFDRPQLRALLDAVRAGKVQMIIVWKIDRLGRSLKHLLRVFELFQKHNVSFISVQENLSFNGALGTFLYSILGAVSQLEASLIQRRTRMGIIASAEIGNFTGPSIPYGYQPVEVVGKRGKRIRIYEEEKKWVQKMYEWYIFDDMGFGQVAKRLNDMGIEKGKHKHERHRTGRWTERHIENILKNTLYRGEFIANKTDENGHILPEEDWTIVAVPPCVSELMFAMAQRKRIERHGNRNRSKHVYLLSGKIEDVSIPQRRKFAGIPRSKRGFSYRRHQFTDSLGEYYPVFEVPAEPLEVAVWQSLTTAISDPEYFLNHYIQSGVTSGRSTDKITNSIQDLREQMANLYLEESRIEGAFEKGIYDMNRAEKRLANLEQKQEKIQSEIDDLENKLRMKSFEQQEIEGLKHAAKQYKYKLNNLDRKQKKLLIDLFVERIELDRKPLENPTGKRTKWHRELKVFYRFNPDLIQRSIADGRTQEAAPTEGKLDSESDIHDTGGERNGRLHSDRSIFYAKYVLEKKKLGKNVNGKTWSIVARLILKA